MVLIFDSFWFCSTFALELSIVGRTSLEVVTSYFKFSFRFEFLIFLNLILYVIASIRSSILKITLGHDFVILHLDFLGSFDCPFIHVCIAVAGSSVKLTSYFEFSFMFDDMIFISLGRSLIIALVSASSLKIAFGHDVILGEFDFLSSVCTFFIIVVSYVAGLSLKGIVSNFELTLRFEFIDMLGWIVDVVAVIGA